MREVLTTHTGAGSASSLSTQLSSASGEAPVLTGSPQPRQHCRAGTAILPGEFLARLYGGGLGIAFQDLLSSLPASGNTWCLFFLVIESPPSYFALSTYLFCFKLFVERVCSSTSPSPWAHFTCTFTCPIPFFQSVCPILWGKWLRAWFITSFSAAPLAIICHSSDVTHPAFLRGRRLAEVGVLAGEGGPWHWLGQLPSPARSDERDPVMFPVSVSWGMCKSGRQWVSCALPIMVER